MSDQDQDGVPDQFDAAPHDPEDRDNFEDCDGIPDVDNDGDGVWDVHDTEPNRPGNPDIASRKDWNPYNIPANEPQTEGGQRNQRTAYPPSSQARQTPKFYPAATTPSASSNLPSTTASAFAAAQSATPSESVPMRTMIMTAFLIFTTAPLTLRKFSTITLIKTVSPTARV
ncbi:MAG: hypothetical protein B6244_03090 [Candidatus Cloacimonetes bacterium 4572_55]|nr:MAG: hypothetical protein B6244_03090 [Candidatus Cloacimonetes bacterium 4572_55]